MKRTTDRAAVISLVLLGIVVLASCDDIGFVSTEEPETYTTDRTNPFYSILPTYVRSVDNTVVLKDELLLEEGDEVPASFTTTELRPCDGWGNEYAFLKFGTHLAEDNFPEGLVYHGRKTVTVPWGMNDSMEYRYAYAIFDGVHLCSASGSSNYYYTLVGRWGSYLDSSINGDFRNYYYGKGGTNGLRLKDVSEALGIESMTGRFRIDFLPQAQANSSYSAPRLSVIEFTPGATGWTEIAAFDFSGSRLPLQSISDAESIVIEPTYENYDDLYVFLSTGDWGASVVFFDVAPF